MFFYEIRSPRLALEKQNEISLEGSLLDLPKSNKSNDFSFKLFDECDSTNPAKIFYSSFVAEILSPNWI